MAILDLYKKGEFKLGVNHSKAGGKAPVTTDVIKGILPQQVVVSYKGDAAEGFVANRTPGDRNITDFNMIDKESDRTIKLFDELDINNDYYVSHTSGKTKVTGYNFEKLFNDGKLTNPKG